MKKIEVYQANNGQTFETEEECRKCDHECEAIARAVAYADSLDVSPREQTRRSKVISEFLIWEYERESPKES